jgi:isopenicillin N synthase-like dioxygenase
MSAPAFAKLQSIDFAKLMSHEPSEIAKLPQAATEDGFFYLDLSGPATQELLRDWKLILPILNRWFDMPLEEKMKHHHGTVLHGYTPVGSYAGVAEGTKDGNETIKVSKRHNLRICSVC